MPAATDLTEREFGNLTAKHRTRRYHGNVMWQCECDCGAAVEVRASYLLRGVRTSCGCQPNDSLVTVEQLRDLLHYGPTTGLFTWLKPQHKEERIGSAAGCLANGYVVIGINGRLYRAHRLAWLYMHGSWPSGVVDHKNTNRSDNRIENLRDVTQQVNTQNRKAANANSQSGLLGAHRSASRSRKQWVARINVGDTEHRLGDFDTAEEAHAAYVEAKRRLHEGCTI
jgi:hypothetical protein